MIYFATGIIVGFLMGFTLGVVLIVEWRETKRRLKQSIPTSGEGGIITLDPEELRKEQQKEWEEKVYGVPSTTNTY